MIKTVGIVSLSSGILGEAFAEHEVKIGVKRLSEYGLTVRFMPHAKKGIEYVREHPKERAEDLLEAFRDPEIDMILCAIGGDDTYRLLPYLFDNDQLFRQYQIRCFWGFPIQPSIILCCIRRDSKHFTDSPSLRISVSWVGKCFPIQGIILKS